MKLKVLGAVVALAGLALAGAAWNGKFDPRRGKTLGPEPARRLEAAGVGNLAEVLPGIYRGAQPTPEGYASLKKLGVKTIVNLRLLHSEKAPVTEAGLNSVEIPLQADVRGATPPGEAEIAHFLDTVLDPKNQPVFFHCAHGEDRTGTMCALIRVEHCGWSNQDALDEMVAFGFSRMWLDFEQFVKAYQPKGKWRRVDGNKPPAVSPGGVAPSSSG